MFERWKVARKVTQIAPFVHRHLSVGINLNCTRTETSAASAASEGLSTHCVVESYVVACQLFGDLFSWVQICGIWCFHTLAASFSASRHLGTWFIFSTNSEYCVASWKSCIASTNSWSSYGRAAESSEKAPDSSPKSAHVPSILQFFKVKANRFVYNNPLAIDIPHVFVEEGGERVCQTRYTDQLVTMWLVVYLPIIPTLSGDVHIQKASE